MRKITLIMFTLLICAAQQVKAQTDSMLIRPTVDKRVELLSIIFRLTGNPEYNRNDFKLYTDRIESHFSPYKNHELISFARSLVKTDGVSYDAVMSMAINLDNQFNLPADYGSLDSRWNRNQVGPFIKLLKKFVKDSRFDAFYHSNENLYQEAVSRFMPIYKSIDTQWYNDFYGQKSNDRFHIILSMSNGPGNYGPSVTDKENIHNVFSVMGAWVTDSVGMVVYPPELILPILIHEFNHSFINFDPEMFRTSGEQIYAAVGEQMARQAYGQWSIVLTEAMVRAAVIKYMKDHNFPAVEITKETVIQKTRGFVWISKLVDELEKYSSDRTTYPTLNSYMPRLAEAYTGFAQYTANYDSIRPKVVSIDEFTNGDTTVRSDIKTITVHFDSPLVGRGHSFNYGHLGMEAMPKIINVNYANDNRTVIIGVELLPGKEYGITLLGLSFRTPEGDAIKPYEISFKTAE